MMHATPTYSPYRFLFCAIIGIYLPCISSDRPLKVDEVCSPLTRFVLCLVPLYKDLVRRLE